MIIPSSYFSSSIIYESPASMSLDTLNFFKAPKFSVRKKTYYIYSVKQKTAGKENSTYSGFYENTSDDPTNLKFLLHLYFGTLHDGWLSVGLRFPEDKFIFIYTCTFTIIEGQDDVFTSKATKRKLCVGKGEDKDVILIDKLYNITDSDKEFSQFSISFHIKFTYVVNDMSLSKDMLSLFESGEDADFSFHVGTRVFKAHKLILSTRSSYFKRMLQSNMMENRLNKVEIKHVDPNMFFIILKFLYSGFIPEELMQIAMKLYPVVDRYEINALKDLCISSIRESISITNVIEVLEFSYTYDVAEIKKLCLSFIKCNFDKLRGTDTWTMVTENIDIVELLLNFAFQNRCYFCSTL